MKRRICRWLFSIVLTGLLLEGVCSGWAWWRFGTLDVTELNERDVGNTYVQQMRAGGITKIVEPHPWLGIVPNSRSPHAGRMVRPAEYPLAKSSDAFTVLLTGGSVAQLLGAHGPEDHPTFQAALERYDFGARRVVILNAAMGATSQPRQAISLLLLGHLADAVVNLDGWNESSRVGRAPAYAEMRNARMDKPANWFTDLNPALVGADRLGAAWQSNWLRGYSREHNSRAAFFITKALRSQIVESAGGYEAQSQVDEMFNLPADWADEQRIALNLDAYRRYVRLMHDMATGTLKIKESYFIQPCPAIGKVLTDAEKRVVGKLDYAAAYQHMADELLTLNKDGILVVSLLDCFDDIDETIYSDSVHCGDKTRGYAIMAERIAAELAAAWQIPQKVRSDH